MSIKLAVRSAFAAALFGIAFTATTPARADVEVGTLSLPKPGDGRLYRRVGARIRLHLHAGRRPPSSNTIKPLSTVSEPKLVSATISFWPGPSSRRPRAWAPVR